MSAMADGTTNTGPEVRSQEDNLRKIILIVAAPMKVAPGRENPACRFQAECHRHSG